jgi:hypothetical protein
MDRLLCYMVDVVSEANSVITSYAFSGASARKLYVIYFFRVGVMAWHGRPRWPVAAGGAGPHCMCDAWQPQPPANDAWQPAYV